MGYTWIPLFTPKPNSNPDIVDKLVVLNTVLGPLRIRRMSFGELLLGLCNGKEIGADTTAFADFIGNTVIAEFEMAGRFIEGRIDNRVLDNNLAQYALPWFSLDPILSQPDRRDPNADVPIDEKIRRAKHRKIHISGLLSSLRPSLSPVF